MGIINTGEKAALLFVANLIETDKTSIEDAATPIVLNVVNGALKVSAAAFSKIPFGIGGMIDAALAAYVATYTSNIAEYEGQGIDALAALLTKIANGLPA